MLHYQGHTEQGFALPAVGIRKQPPTFSSVARGDAPRQAHESIIPPCVSPVRSLWSGDLAVLVPVPVHGDDIPNVLIVEFNKAAQTKR